MYFLVTAGGTSEPIDAVRSITNSATGRLGSLIAERLADLPDIEGVFYVCGKGALCPATVKVEIIPVTDTAELEIVVKAVLLENRIDGIIHSMAVSDYRVHAVTTPQLLAKDIFALGASNEAAIARIIRETAGVNRDIKLSSDEKNLVLVLEPTIKIISLFHQLSPSTLVVGFKLLDKVPHDVLIDTAFSLLQKNHCEYVLANDAQDISGDKHIGYLVGKDKSVVRYEDKQSIACGIVQHLTNVLKGIL